MIRRAAMCDVSDINAWVKRDSGEDVDFTAHIGCPLNVFLISGNGGAMFLWRGPGIYEVHVFFEQRGRDVIDISHRMLGLMRERGAKLFWAAVPVESRHVIIFTRLMGWVSHGVQDFPHGYCEVFSGK